MVVNLELFSFEIFDAIPETTRNHFLLIQDKILFQGKAWYCPSQFSFCIESEKLFKRKYSLMLATENLHNSYYRDEK
jgi:hypothetical protein